MAPLFQFVWLKLSALMTSLLSPSILVPVPHLAPPRSRRSRITIEMLAGHYGLVNPLIYSSHKKRTCHLFCKLPSVWSITFWGTVTQSALVHLPIFLCPVMQHHRWPISSTPAAHPLPLVLSLLRILALQVNKFDYLGGNIVMVPVAHLPLQMVLPARSRVSSHLQFHRPFIIHVWVHIQRPCQLLNTVCDLSNFLYIIVACHFSLIHFSPLLSLG